MPWEPSSASMQNPLSQEDLLRLESERKKRRKWIIYVTIATVIVGAIVIVAVKVR